MQEKHKKTGITGFLILLFLLLGILAFFPQKAYADTTKHDVSFTISDASSTLLDKESNLYTINKGIWTLNFNLEIQVQLPSDTSKIVSIKSTYDSMNVDYDKAATITYGDNGLCTVLFAKPSSNIVRSTLINGSAYFDFLVDTDGVQTTYRLLVAADTFDSQFWGNVNRINVKDMESNEILSDNMSITKGDLNSKVLYLSPSDCSGKLAFNVLRTQDDLEPVIKATQYGQWISIGCNYISVNGGAPQRFDVDSRQSQNNVSETVTLKKGWNEINLFFIRGKGGYLGSKKRFSIYFPFPDFSNPLESKPIRDDTNCTVATYLIHWDGADAESAQASSDASIKALDPINYGRDATDEMTVYPYQLGDNSAEIVLPKSTTTTAMLCGIIPNSAGSQVTVEGLDESKYVCGNYFFIKYANSRLFGEDIEKNVVQKDDQGRQYFTVHVTAPDGVTKKDYKIYLLYKSSEAQLKSVNIKGATVDNLEEGLGNGEDSFIMKLDADDGDVTLSDFQVSDGATFTVDGKTVQDGSITVKPGNVTRIHVTAEDTITSKDYYLVHQKQDGTYPYFTVSDETRKQAEALLGNWYDRTYSNLSSMKLKKDLTGDVWPVFEVAATDKPGDGKNDLDGMVVSDPNDKNAKLSEWSQPSDYAKVILYLCMIGENPWNYTDPSGNNLVTYLQANWDGPYAQPVWSLMALKAAGAEIPEQCKTTVKGMAKSASVDLDIRGWCLSAIGDMVSKEELAKIVESFRPALLTSGPEAGMFYNSWYPEANTISHGCVLEGLAGAGVDPENIFSVSDTASPLKSLWQYVNADGSYAYNRSGSVPNNYMKDMIIGLGDTLNGDNVWKRYGLTLTKYNTLLTSVSAYLGGEDAKTADADKLAALNTAYEAAKTAYTGAASPYGIGQQYYNLYEAMAALDPTVVGKPDVRICTMEQSDQVDAVIEKLDKLQDLASVTDDQVKEAREAYDALGGDDETLQKRLQSYVKNASNLTEAESYRAFAGKVDAIGEVTADSGDAIAAAQEAYGKLDEPMREKEIVQQKYSVLQDADAIYKALTAIAAIPETDQLTAADADTVKAAREAYDLLSRTQKAKITTASRLIQAEERLRDLTAISSVVQAIDALPAAADVTLDNQDEVAKAQAQFQALTQAQQALVGEERSSKLQALVAAIAQQQSDAQQVAAVVNAVDALPDPAALTVDNYEQYETAVTNAAGMYNALATDILRSRVTNADKLKKLQDSIADLRSRNLLAQAEALPDASALTGKEEDGSDVQVTSQTLKEIAYAQNLYDAMADDDRQIFANEHPELNTKLQELFKAAGVYDEYVQDVLQPLVDKIGALETPLTRENLAEANELIDKYNSNDAAKTYLDSITYNEGTENAFTLKDKMAEVQKQADQLTKDLADAAEVDAELEKLPQTVTSREERDAAEKSLQAAEEKVKALNDQARANLAYADRVTALQNAINAFDADKTAADALQEKIEAAQNALNESQTADSTVAALKTAEEAYNAAESTPTVKALLADGAREFMEASADAEQQIQAAKQKALQTKAEKNGLPQLAEGSALPWDVMLTVEPLAQSNDSYGTLQNAMKGKDAEALKAFTLTAKRILADGTEESWTPETALPFTLDAGQDLTGRTVYLALLPTAMQRTHGLMRAAVSTAGTTDPAWVNTSVNSSLVSFSADQMGSYMLGLKNAAAADNQEEEDDNKNNNENLNGQGSGQNGSGGNAGTPASSGSGNTGNTGNAAKTANGTAGKTASGTTAALNATAGGASGVPQTGDPIPQETAAALAMVLLGAAVFALARKKKKELQ